MESTNTNKSKVLWVGYGAELLTALFAITVLAGRVYSQSYWSVFGLSPELTHTNVINYAIMSPSTAVASLLMAISTVLFIALLRGEPPDFVGDSNPKVVYYIGFFAWWIGLFLVTIALIGDRSKWVPGTPGLIFGFGYLLFITSPLIWMQAGLKLESGKRPKWEIAFFRWLRRIPSILVQAFLIVAFTASSLYGIMETAQKFGSDEAKMMYNVRPWATLQLDSTKGFEDLALVSNSDGTAALEGKIIAEAGGFLYISLLTSSKDQILVRGVPLSRVQAIRYQLEATPIGE